MPRTPSASWAASRPDHTSQIGTSPTSRTCPASLRNWDRHCCPSLSLSLSRWLSSWTFSKLSAGVSRFVPPLTGWFSERPGPYPQSITSWRLTTRLTGMPWSARLGVLWDCSTQQAELLVTGSQSAPMSYGPQSSSVGTPPSHRPRLPCRIPSWGSSGLGSLSAHQRSPIDRQLPTRSWVMWTHDSANFDWSLRLDRLSWPHRRACSDRRSPQSCWSNTCRNRPQHSPSQAPNSRVLPRDADVVGAVVGA